MLTHSSRKTREMAYPSPTNWPTRLRSDQWFFMAKPRHSHAVCTLWVHLLRTLPDKTFWNWKSDDAYMHHWLVKKFSSSLQTPDVDTIVHWKLKYTMYVVVEIVDTWYKASMTTVFCGGHAQLSARKEKINEVSRGPAGSPILQYTLATIRVRVRAGSGYIVKYRLPDL